jgi:hypothetical protein
MLKHYDQLEIIASKPFNVCNLKLNPVNGPKDRLTRICCR